MHAHTAGWEEWMIQWRITLDLPTEIDNQNDLWHEKWVNPLENTNNNATTTQMIQQG